MSDYPADMKKDWIDEVNELFPDKDERMVVEEMIMFLQEKKAYGGRPMGELFVAWLKNKRRQGQ